MNEDNLITEYLEDSAKMEPEGLFVVDVSDISSGEADAVMSKSDMPLGSNPLVLTFEEDDREVSYEEEEEEPLKYEDVELTDSLISDLGEDFSGEIEEFQEELEDNPGVVLPGAVAPIKEEEQENSVADTNWADDGDTSKFIYYLRDMFNSVPSHDGNSISGCEKAMAHLERLNKEISLAVRGDSKDALSEVLDEVEDYRVKILQGMVALKTRIGELKKKFKEEASQKRASEDLELMKQAKSGKVQVFITAFERAISGILVNAVVSAGHPFEDVYDYLKDKFDITEREELAILQIVMDMGYPIFKDRGIIGGDEEGDDNKDGVDFMKNYFA